MSWFLNSNFHSWEGSTLTIHFWTQKATPRLRNRYVTSWLLSCLVNWFIYDPFKTLQNHAKIATLLYPIHSCIKNINPEIKLCFIYPEKYDQKFISISLLPKNERTIPFLTKIFNLIFNTPMNIILILKLKSHFQISSIFSVKLSSQFFSDSGYKTIVIYLKTNNYK